jgi:hypothetical protein
VSPVSDLAELLRTMRPVLRPGVWVFCSVPRDAHLAQAVAWFQEDEGQTAILAEAEARRLGLAALYRAAWITLTVHSDLNAVGLLAAVSRALANAGISCNVVSAVHHDHLFVPYGQADEAISALAQLQAQGERDGRAG